MRLSYKLLSTILRVWRDELSKLHAEVSQGRLSQSDLTASLERMLGSVTETEADLRRYGQGDEF